MGGRVVHPFEITPDPETGLDPGFGAKHQHHLKTFWQPHVESWAREQGRGLFGYILPVMLETGHCKPVTSPTMVFSLATTLGYELSELGDWLDDVLAYHRYAHDGRAQYVQMVDLALTHAHPQPKIGTVDPCMDCVGSVIHRKVAERAWMAERWDRGKYKEVIAAYQQEIGKVTRYILSETITISGLIAVWASEGFFEALEDARKTKADLPPHTVMRWATSEILLRTPSHYGQIDPLRS